MDNVNHFKLYDFKIGYTPLLSLDSNNQFIVLFNLDQHIWKKISMLIITSMRRKF